MKAEKIWNYVVALSALTAGFFLITLPDEVCVIVGACLLMYGSYKAVVTYLQLPTIEEERLRPKEPIGTVQTVTVHTDRDPEEAYKALEEEYGLQNMKDARIIIADLLRRVKRLEHKTRVKGTGFGPG